MDDTALVIMAKRPSVGQAKSRLSPALTPSEAAALYEALLLDTIELAGGLEEVQLAIAITPPDALDYFRCISPPRTVLLPVAGADIGECLNETLGWLLGDGHAKAMAINSDGPTLPITFLQQARARLEDDEIDVVLGPSEDGGYYLIGLKQPHPGLFEGISWSTSRVSNQTLAKAEAMGLEVAQLPTWYDVDSPAELDRLRAELPTLPDSALRHTRRLLNGSGQTDTAGTDMGSV
jgi:rSAM/selenodomain-associated transferase 1